MLPKLPNTPRDSVRRVKSNPKLPGGQPSRKAASHTSLSSELLNPILREEDLFRMAVGGHEDTAFTSIILQLQLEEGCSDRRLLSEGYHNSKSNAAVLISCDRRLDSLEGTTTDIASLIGALKTEVRSHIDSTQSAERQRLQQLETENAMLKKDLAAAKEELERKDSVVQGVRDTLSRRLIRTQIENEMIKDEVRAAIKDARLDLEGMQRRLHAAIEKAVLNYQSTAYTGALRSLQDISEEVRRKVLSQSATLHTLVDSVGATDPTEEIKTMHSNLPPLYRRQLEGFSREQLLGLVDILSFEEGTVDCVGKALYAANPHKTQNVFN